MTAIAYPRTTIDIRGFWHLQGTLLNLEAATSAYI